MPPNPFIKSDHYQNSILFVCHRPHIEFFGRFSCYKSVLDAMMRMLLNPLWYIMFGAAQYPER